MLMITLIYNEVVLKICNVCANEEILFQAWRGMTRDRTCASQHTPKIILGTLLLRTLDIKIARFVLIFKLQH